MKSDRVWMNLFRLVRIPVSLALDEHAKQYVLALFPGWSPRLQQFHMYSLRSFLVCIQVLSAVKVSLLWPILYKKVCTFTMCEVKRNRRSTKSLSRFLAFLYIAIKHTGLAIHREHWKQRWLCISATHMSEAIFTSQLKNKEKIDRRCWQQRASHSKISNAYLAKINEQNLTRLSHSKISNAYDCGMGRVCHQFGHWHGTSC